jgi:hypothetical protein
MHANIALHKSLNGRGPVVDVTSTVDLHVGLNIHTSLPPYRLSSFSHFLFEPLLLSLLNRCCSYRNCCTKEIDGSMENSKTAITIFQDKNIAPSFNNKIRNEIFGHPITYIALNTMK